MDDLVDLSWSDSSKPTSKSSTPQATASSSTSFDFLSLSKPLSASSGGNTPNYYSSTPLRSSTPSQPPVPRLNGATNNAKPISRSGTPIQSSSPQLGTGGLDAFSSLLAMPSSSSNAANKNMSMAERQKAMEDEKKRKDEEERKRFEAEGHFWDNLGSSASANVVKPPTKPVVQQEHDFDDFLKPTPTTNSATRAKSLLPLAPNDILSPASSSGPSKPSSSAGTFWDNHHDSDIILSGSTSKPSQAQNKSKLSPAPPVDPFDFDALSASMSQPQSQPQTNGANGISHTLDDDDDFDILGDLGKPVTARPPKAEPGPSRPSRSSASSSRSSSPPPHIVGQIVEMGFSPIQARQALAKTTTGLDVQAALEILLGGQNSGSTPEPRSRDQDNFGEDDADEDFIERERQRREEEERERRRRRRQGPSRESVKARSAEEKEKEASTQEQAEKILAQASEIGTNMFNKATNFWNSSKERAMKAYEEQRKVMEANAAAAGTNGEARKPVKDGRPRWMIEGNDDDWKDQPSGKEKGGFRDDDGENDAPQTRPKGKQPQTNGAGSSRQPAITTSSTSGSSSNYKSSKERADLLFADESPRYVSPARHRKKSPTPTPAPPRALPSRTLVSATSSQLEKSATYKAKGNEHFKLGRFAEAESSYTTAISQLPEGHLFLIPLHNNRAAARLKLGHSSPAVEDCTMVIDLIGPTYHPTKEAPLPPEIAKEVKLFDGLVKALSKRAQAWEMGEKWKNALEDWEKILGMDLSVLGVGASGTKNLAADGARRARKMLEGDSNSKSNSNTATTTANPRPRPAVAPNSVIAKPADVNRSAAVSELRAAAKQLELEDDQRLALKDSIEAKLNNWKNGKETNLRALIASLDLVLWDEIMKTGGMKVGMHELISEKQVKIRYMKVIARLHPDKLNSQNTTVEQRMLANGAFGTLNEA
nr:hypothetical protein I302_02063 [Kwoniella bestiolae CBS 10118]OCF27223.1 hypothetical protein I302_02063 [Kwoniella bestiolae CBS 10118]